MNESLLRGAVAMPSTRPIMRTPSSRSTREMLYGRSGFVRNVVTECTVPAPDACSHVRVSLSQCGQNCLG